MHRRWRMIGRRHSRFHEAELAHHQPRGSTNIVDQIEVMGNHIDSGHIVVPYNYIAGNGAGTGYRVMAEVFPTSAAPTGHWGRMNGKVCLVTGGGSGIGRAAALRMAEEGAAAVLIAGRRESEIEKVGGECRVLGAEALAIRTDVTREDEVARLVATALDNYGRLDAAFNNAGV